MSLKEIVARGCVMALSLAPVAALAQENAAPSFSLDLNNVADIDPSGCRLTYVAANGSDEDLSAVSYQVAVFDGQGVVTDLLVLEFGAMIAGKTNVVQFDLPNRGCADISRITVNQVAACGLADGTTADFCLTGLETSSRTVIQFGI